MKHKALAMAIAGALGHPAAWAEEQVMPEMVISLPRPAVVTNNPSPSAEVTQDQMREMNVINVEDALKYTPSLFIRKRYVGDRNGIVASRTAGSLQSAWSLVYADGLLLSNLLGNSYNFPPRWNIVGSEEIENIEVLYGPFSALLPGNSAGATILINTRRPQQFEAHARVQGWTQDYKHYATDDTYRGHQEQVALGARVNSSLSWSFLFNHLDTHSQPINFATAAVPTANSVAGTPVTGGVAYTNPTNVSSMMFGATSLDHSVQDTMKIRLAYDFTPDTRAASPIALAPSDSNTKNQLLGLSLDSRLSSDWSIELSASDYSTPRDVTRTPTPTTPVAGGLGQPGSAGGRGTITFGDDTGWRTLDARAIWKPGQGTKNHTVTFGYHYDHYTFSSAKYSASRWTDDGSIGAAPSSITLGDTRTDAL
ncbi:MAG: TonB-dependent receptor plug domain-containing protein, partial [Thiobacillus sp.]|nr:TonB-dependent receptor plug domain-containing protein [Thiobacillus sp.]